MENKVQETGLGTGSKALPKRLGSGVKKADKFTKPEIRRLCRRAGIKRIDAKMYEKVNEKTREFLETILRDSYLHTEHAKLKTVTTAHVLAALKRNGNAMYGY